MDEWMTEEEADNPAECLATRMRRAQNFGAYIDYVAAATWKGTHTTNIGGQYVASFNPVTGEGN